MTDWSGGSGRLWRGDRSLEVRVGECVVGRHAEGGIKVEELLEKVDGCMGQRRSDRSRGEDGRMRWYVPWGGARGISVWNGCLGYRWNGRRTISG